MEIKLQKNAVLPKGFLAAGVRAGIKRKRLDLALVYSAVPARAAVMATTNNVQAAPIKINRQHCRRQKAFQAIVVNSGNANCFTGRQGMRDASGMAAAAGRVLGIASGNVLIASTGIIGRRLPLEKIEHALPQAAASLTARGIRDAARAIMTTDTFSKEVTVKVAISGTPVTICGVAKGSGMIAPNMATMLAFIFTDACVGQAALNKALRFAVERSFNCIDVDGCMSTNDTVITMANGASGAALITAGASFRAFSFALNVVCLELAKMIARDGEGATKFIRIKVSGARSFQEARRVGLSVARSMLFKSALYGCSPNFFGRAVAAVGASGVGIREEGLHVHASSLKKREVEVVIALKRGSAQAQVFTCDLTHDYIKINTEYN